MNTRDRRVAVVVPVFNEQVIVGRFYEELVAVLRAEQFSYSIVFVDDGSTDETLAELNAVADRDDRVTVLSLSRNRGHQHALAAGLDLAEGDAVVVMDGDLQHPPREIPRMFALYEAGADVVYAVRRNPNGAGFVKRWLSQGFYALLERYSDVAVIRNAADFRLTSMRVVGEIRKMREMHRYLRGMVPWLGFPFSVVHYEQANRAGGIPSYTLRKSLRLARDAVFSFSTLPLELLAWVAGAFAAIAGGYLVYVAWVWWTGHPVVGWTSVMAALLLSGALHLTAVAVSAKYLGMIFEEVKRRPLYSLKQRRLGRHADPGGTHEG